MLGVEAQGKAIETIEGMAEGDHLHVLQQKFLEHAALQCGICTPGMLIAAKALAALSGVSAAVAVASAVVQYGLRDDAGTYIADQTFDFKQSLNTYTGIGIIAMVLSIASLVVTVLWAFRMAKNLSALGRTNASFRPAATIAVNVLGSCTLGILAFMMWKELWRGSDPDTPSGDLEWKKAPYPTIIILHLAFTLAAGVLGLTAGAIAGIGNTSRNFCCRFV